MGFPLYQFIFFVFATITIVASLLVVFLKNPVYSVLFLVLAFFASSVLWMMLQAEFLALVLIFVYVGAVMTLFLFVVMMLNLDLYKMREKFMRFFPIGVLFALCLIALLVVAFRAKDSAMDHQLLHLGANYSNTQAMGMLLYTHYLFPFEMAGAILIVAIVAAIILAFRGHAPNTRFQNIAQQHAVKKADRLRIVTLEVEKNDTIK